MLDTIVTVSKVPAQQQHGSVDCGLFAIANIVALCFGFEPNKILFCQDRMRSHLISCLEGCSIVCPKYILEEKTL